MVGFASHQAHALHKAVFRAGNILVDRFLGDTVPRFPHVLLRPKTPKKFTGEAALLTEKLKKKNTLEYGQVLAHQFIAHHRNLKSNFH